MKRIIGVLLVSGCALHTRTARFVDASESTSKAWICVPDQDVTNFNGVMCGDLGAVKSLEDAAGGGQGGGGAGGGGATSL